MDNIKVGDKVQITRLLGIGIFKPNDILTVVKKGGGDIYKLIDIEGNIDYIHRDRFTKK